MKFSCGFSWCSSLIVLGLNAIPVAAQIAPDGSLPSSITSPDGLNFTIDNGALSGNNLFHSFSEFSVPTNGSAFFNNAADVQNIFSRVTGGNISNIDGLLRANGGANLFLLNPAGIVFGPNARLDIGGSFFGSTADSVVFQDGSVFSATEANAPPLLTIDVPVGLQMGTNPGNIQVQGTGHQISGQIVGFSPLDRSKNPIGLQVRGGNTLALVGANVQLDGGVLNAAGGRIEIGAVGGTPGTATEMVGLNATDLGWQFNYAGIENLGNIDLSGKALVDISGEGGAIHLQGAHINLVGGSVLFVNSQGAQLGGSIGIDASESIVFSGTAANGFPTLLRYEVSGTGGGGDIELTTRNLVLSDRAMIDNRNFSLTPSGRIVIEALQTAQVIGSPSTPFSSSIQSITVSNGTAGDVILSSPQVRILDQGSFSSVSAGRGSAGNVTIDASESIVSSGTIAATTFVAGQGGTVRINTPRLVVREGGRIAASTFGTGNAGRVEIDAAEFVEVSGTLPGGTEATRINSNAQLAPPVFQRLGAPPTPSGDAGGVTINTPFLRVSDRGQVTVENAGSGNAGELQLNANTIVLDTEGKITAATRSGAGGDIVLNVQDSLQLHRGSAIDAQAGGTGTGGNVTIDAHTIALLENSRITANAFEGAGGNIQVSTQGLFASPDSSITASSQFGVSGTVAITNPTADSSLGVANLPQDPIDPGQQLAVGCQQFGESQFVATGRGGIPASPDSTIQGTRIWNDLRDVSALEDGEPVESATVPAIPELLTEATTWVRNDRGQIELVAVTERMGDRFSPPQCDPVVSDR